MSFMAFTTSMNVTFSRSYALGQERNGRNDSTESLKVFIQSINSNFPQQTITCQEDSTSKYATVDFAKMDMTEEGQMIVAICTPLMRRVHHTLKHSGEIVFIDSTGNVDRTGVRVFLLVTHSCLGGLPLGVIITSSESTSTIKASLKLLCSVIGPSGFFGRGQKGPFIFMTDDSRAERAALAEIFPESGQLLCAFHLLQAFWRYIWDQKTQVHRDQRQHIFHLVKDIMYADNKEMMDRIIEKVLTDEVLSKYIHVQDYIKKNLLDRKSVSAICLREGLPICGNNTNNSCEAAMHILKDQVLMRTKAFNPQQLVDFLCHDLEAYYGRKCIDIANGQLQEHIAYDFITQVGGSKEMQFDVRSMRDPNVVYRVDMTVGFCTCRNGNTGGPCKHQANVIRKFQIRSWNFIPENNPEMRQIICYIGTGQYHASSWFDNLKSDNRSADTKLGEFENAIHNEGSVSPKPEAQKSETYNIVSLSQGLKRLFDDWNNKLIQDPQSYAKGIDALLKNAKKITYTIPV
ncbi:uncharacterized protein LOC112567089 [Pomacea canaliculata]|uniref:uncharacterized protein LOC112567089 n=1 Tax=Pomacea canaliculata TaxID=400727 RepID=UPI000D727431|nr:uncharacterized protein LOC112567089 [Pomacea canaliculata]